MRELTSGRACSLASNRSFDDAKLRAGRPPAEDAWHLATLVAVDRALHGDCVTAVELTRRLLRANADAVASARSPLGYVASTAMAGNTLDLAALLLEGCPSGSAELAPMIAALPDRVTLRPLVIADYVAFTALIDLRSRKADGVVIDRANVRAILDPHYARLIDCVEDDRVACPEAPRAALPSMVHNPIGKSFATMALDAERIRDLLTRTYTTRRAQLLAMARP